MADPRLNGRHLGVARHERYDVAVDAMLDERGPVTEQADPLACPPKAPPVLGRREALPPEGTYTLVSLGDGRRYPLRVGITTIGRFPENDLVLTTLGVSRRHCVILVHATGGCEVYDTASRRGTWVNCRRIGRVELHPGDILMLSSEELLLAWLGPDGANKANKGDAARYREINDPA